MTVPACTCGLPSADWTHVTWSADRPTGAHDYTPAQEPAELERLPGCAIRGHHSRDAHRTYCRPAIDAAWHAHPNPSPRTQATIADPDRYRALRAQILARVAASDKSASPQTGGTNR